MGSDNFNQIIQDRFSDKREYRKLFVYPVAESLYQDFQKSISSIPSSGPLNKEFKNLTKTEKSFWYNYVTEIPYKFSTGLHQQVST